MPNIDRLKEILGTKSAPTPPNRKTYCSPATARQSELSTVFSLDDEPHRPSDRLFDLALSATQAAREISLEGLRPRVTESGEANFLAEVWPGEHYRLLAALTQVLKPSLVVEIGTGRGLSALSILEKLPHGGRLVTYDIVPWTALPGSFLRNGDFTAERFEQRTVDLSDRDSCFSERDLLKGADLIFIDAAKDGEQECRFMEDLAEVPFERPPIVIMDDIRVWSMLRAWRELAFPKLDLTSFGHWSGTGLVDFQCRKPFQ